MMRVRLLLKNRTHTHEAGHRKLDTDSRRQTTRTDFSLTPEKKSTQWPIMIFHRKNNTIMKSPTVIYQTAEVIVFPQLFNISTRGGDYTVDLFSFPIRRYFSKASRYLFFLPFGRWS